MEKQNNDPLELGRQPDPEPPLHGTAPPPSLLIYLVLFLASLLLVVIALNTKCSNLSSFTMNLSTELIGAIIILIIVERRFRDSEIKAIRGLPAAAKSAFLSVINSESKEVKAYAGIVTSSINRVSLPYYIERPELEHELEAKATSGVILIGEPGIGKTTLLQHLVLHHAAEVMKDPTKSIVPVIIPIRAWTDGEVEDIIFGQMNTYYSVSKKSFDKLVKKGRLLCVFDGIDESLNPTDIINKILKFKQKFSTVRIAVSSRPNIADSLLRNLGLAELRVSPLPEESRSKIFKARTELSDMLLFLTPEAIMRASDMFRTTMKKKHEGSDENEKI